MESFETFEDIVRFAAGQKASDIHLSAGRPPSWRVDGEMREAEALPPLTPEDTERLAFSLCDEARKARFRETGDIDFAHSSDGLRLRVNLFKRRETVALVARILNSRIPAPEELGVPEALVRMTDKKRGLVLVTGATGSGKSTTLASLIDLINEKERGHVITLEDPIEYVHGHKRSVVSQREIGSDTHSFASALRAALRQDPDVILVGEMRDPETISTAVTAAETGHLVFSTLHTVGAANTVDRIIDVFEPHKQAQIRVQLADVLECVVSQQLLPRKRGGRVAATEVMVSTGAIRNHIREAKTFQITSAIQTGRNLGMITMDDAIALLFERGEIEMKTALLYARDRAALEKKLTGAAGFR
jgi:twitching motility protein PilT